MFTAALLMLHYYDDYLKDGAPSILLQDDNFASVRAVVNHGVIVIPATEIKTSAFSEGFYRSVPINR